MAANTRIMAGVLRFERNQAERTAAQAARGARRDGSGEGFGRFRQCLGRQSGWRQIAENRERNEGPEQHDAERIGSKRRATTSHAGRAAAAVAGAVVGGAAHGPRPAGAGAAAAVSETSITPRSDGRGLLTGLRL